MLLNGYSDPANVGQRFFFIGIGILLFGCVINEKQQDYALCAKILLVVTRNNYSDLLNCIENSKAHPSW